jgi:hypothetical protein
MTEQEDPVQRSKRLRDQIQRIKSGRSLKRPGDAQSLREQIDRRSNQVRTAGAAKPLASLGLTTRK